MHSITRPFLLRCPKGFHLTCLLGLLLSSLSIQAAEDVFFPPSTESDLMAILPMNIRHLNIKVPKVDFKIQVSKSGDLVDFAPIYASHTDLVSRGCKTLQKAVFKPATQNGTPIPSTSNISVFFYDPVIKTGAYNVEQSGMDHIQDMLFTMNKSQYEYNLSLPKDLDAPLQIVERGQSAAPYDDNGDPIIGTAVVEFYIDYEGVPRLPSIKSSDHIEISKAAVYTIQQLRFSEPKHNKNPTTVKAQMPISYKKPAPAKDQTPTSDKK